jgi:hypothetical protein
MPPRFHAIVVKLISTTRSTEESAPSASKPGDFILFKIDVNLGLGSSGDQLGIGNSFTPSEPMQPSPTPIQPSKKATKKSKGAKPQKLVTPVPNRGSLPPKQIKQPSPKNHQSVPKVLKNPGKQPTPGLKTSPSRPLQLHPKAHPQIKSIVVPKTIQAPRNPQFSQNAPWFNPPCNTRSESIAASVSPCHIEVSSSTLSLFNNS